MKPASFLVPFVLIPLAGDPKDVSIAPDIIPAGMRAVETELKVDTGPFTNCLCRHYQVRKGDTLSEIAKRECGDVDCSEEIRLLNSWVNFEKLEADADILIPPPAMRAESRATSRPSDRDASSWVLFKTSEFDGAESPYPILEGEPLQSRGQTRVIAIARDKLRSVLSTRLTKLDPANPPDGVMCSPLFFVPRIVREGEPTVKIQTWIVLKRAKDGRPALEVSERRLGKRGKLISEQSAGTPRKGGMEWPLMLIGAGAMLGVIGLAWRRRAQMAGGRGA